MKKLYFVMLVLCPAIAVAQFVTAGPALKQVAAGTVATNGSVGGFVSMQLVDRRGFDPFALVEMSLELRRMPEGKVLPGGTMALLLMPPEWTVRPKFYCGAGGGPYDVFLLSGVGVERNYLSLSAEYRAFSALEGWHLRLAAFITR